MSPKETCLKQFVRCLFLEVLLRLITLHLIQIEVTIPGGTAHLTGFDQALTEH